MHWQNNPAPKTNLMCAHEKYIWNKNASIESLCVVHMKPVQRVNWSRVSSYLHYYEFAEKNYLKHMEIYSFKWMSNPTQLHPLYRRHLNLCCGIWKRVSFYFECTNILCICTICRTLCVWPSWVYCTNVTLHTQQCVFGIWNNII